MPNSPLSDSHGPLLRRIASTTRNVRIDILDEQETLLAPVGLCDLCSMPNKPGYDYCYPCSTAPRAAVDGLIPLAFAPKGEQLYRDLVAYKRQSTPSPAFRRLAALARVSSRHMPCIERVYGAIDTLTVVLPAYAGMIRPHSVSRPDRSRAPRVCGDDPARSQSA